MLSHLTPFGFFLKTRLHKYELSILVANIMFHEINKDAYFSKPCTGICNYIIFVSDLLKIIPLSTLLWNIYFLSQRFRMPSES